MSYFIELSSNIWLRQHQHFKTIEAGRRQSTINQTQHLEDNALAIFSRLVWWNDTNIAGRAAMLRFQRSYQNPATAYFRIRCGKSRETYRLVYLSFPPIHCAKVLAIQRPVTCFINRSDAFDSILAFFFGTYTTESVTSTASLSMNWLQLRFFPLRRVARSSANICCLYFLLQMLY